MGIIEKAKDKLERNVTGIENRDDLPDDEKVTRIIKVFSAGCAGVAIQPIPFADFFVLTPLQAYMGTRIAAIRGLPVSEASAARIFKELAGVVGLGLLAQQLVIGAYKTFIPFLGAITTIPIVYGLTYGMGRVMDEYFRRKKRGEAIDPQALKDVFREARKKGKEEGKARRSDIKAGKQDSDQRE